MFTSVASLLGALYLWGGWSCIVCYLCNVFVFICGIVHVETSIHNLPVYQYKDILYTVHSLSSVAKRLL